MGTINNTATSLHADININLHASIPVFNMLLRNAWIFIKIILQADAGDDDSGRI